MKNILLLCTATLMLFSCKKNNKCEDAICTLVLVSYQVKVVDANNEKVVLKDFYTVNVTKGDTMRRDGMMPDSTYTLLDDGYVNSMYNQTYSFRFYGVTQSDDVFSADYTFSADCCHINKESGDNTITLNK